MPQIKIVKRDLLTDEKFFKSINRNPALLIKELGEQDFHSGANYQSFHNNLKKMLKPVKQHSFNSTSRNFFLSPDKSSYFTSKLEPLETKRWSQ